VEFVASLSQGRTAAAQCGFFTYKSVPVIFEPPCIWKQGIQQNFGKVNYGSYVTQDDTKIPALKLVQDDNHLPK